MDAGANGSATSRTLLLVDSLGLSDQQVGDLSGKLGIAVKSRTSRELLGVDGASAATTDVTAAIALAIVAAKQQIPLDFEHSRLTPTAPRRFGRGSIWGACIGAAALAIVVWLLVAASQRQSTLRDLQKKLVAINPDVAAAKASIDRLNYGRGFFPENRPSAIDCLREITMAFRNDERIWTTSFTVREGGKSVLSGKAADQKTILRVLDGLKQTGKFIDVKLIDMREADNRGNEMSFSIGFTYMGVG